MSTICRAFSADDEARAAVDRLLAGGVPGAEIRVLTGERSGGFGDIDRETVTSYADGVRRVHIASHRNVKKMLVEAGLDPDASDADVDALHHGRVLVLVRTDSPAVDRVELALDASSPA